MHIMKNTLNGAKWSENIFSLSTSYNFTSDKYKLSEVKFGMFLQAIIVSTSRNSVYD